ncbi:MAG: aspartate/glutamate racemase family protein [Pseudomonadota bacterium]
MIGIFDSGLGGLTVLRALQDRFPNLDFLYLGDHAHVPYGNRPSDQVVELTRLGVEALFERGALLVLLGCNTATAVAARRLQQNWLPGAGWDGRNVIGIVAPTVEAATQTPWAVTTPQYPQKYNTDRIAVFGTTRTITSGVYVEEIRKRCPRVQVVQQICAHLAGAIEDDVANDELDGLVRESVEAMMVQMDGAAPDRAILGCTHFPLVEALFRQHLPAGTRILSQPQIVSDSMVDYLDRHPNYAQDRVEDGHARVQVLTTGDASEISARASIFWPGAPSFSRCQIR